MSTLACIRAIFSIIVNFFGAGISLESTGNGGRITLVGGGGGTVLVGGGGGMLLVWVMGSVGGLS